MTDGDFGGLCENGHDVPPGARFCPHCGSPAYTSHGLDGPPPPPTDPLPTDPPPQWSGSHPIYPPPPYAAAPSPPAYGSPAYGSPGYGAAGYHPPAYGSTPAAYPPPAPPYWPRTRARPTNGLAIASMVLGILWIWWIGSILAVIFGHIAIRQIRSSGERGRGMAITGLVLGYLGVAAVILLIISVVVASGSSGG